MTFTPTERVQCAILPTRLERLARYEATLPGVEVWIKRDDQTGFLTSGNKIRKLEFSLGRALAEGANGIVTCGGLQSNHCRAAVALATRLGLSSHLLLRTPDGKLPETLEGNALVAGILGAKIIPITPAQYRERDSLMAEHANRCGRVGEHLFVIPEGASDPVGSMGYALAAEEIESQLRTRHMDVDYVVHAVGSGGTSAGLSAGKAKLGAHWTPLGIPVCDDAATFEGRVRQIRGGMEALGWPGYRGGEVEFLDGCQGRGYGLTTPEELAWIRDFARQEGILLDPCYTGKAFFGLHRAIVDGRFREGTRLLFVHTGGTFANFAYGREWNDVV